MVNGKWKMMSTLNSSSIHPMKTMSTVKDHASQRTLMVTTVSVEPTRKGIIQSMKCTNSAYNNRLVSWSMAECDKKHPTPSHHHKVRYIYASELQPTLAGILQTMHQPLETRVCNSNALKM